jgi:NADPH-dependent glutamate synthase beta subunit-like oxidoreductase
MSAGYLKRSFDAVLITAGAGMPRDLDVPGRKLKGIHFALDFLTQQNRLNSGESIPKPKAISAKGLKVVVIGGGDTGSDCVGTSIRQGAKSVTQIELLPKPSESRPEDNPWPNWPNIMRTSSSQDEGCERDWGVLTKAFIGQGKVKKLSCVRIEWFRDASGFKFKEIPGSAFELEADLVLLATGFVHVEHGPLIKDFGIELTPAGHIAVDGSFMTSASGVFAAGDSVLGASLVVKAIYQGLAAADGVDAYLRRNGKVVKAG